MHMPCSLNSKLKIRNDTGSSHMLHLNFLKRKPFALKELDRKGGNIEGNKTKPMSQATLYHKGQKSHEYYLEKGSTEY